MCDCVDKINDKMTGTNQRIKRYWTLGDEVGEAIGIEVEKVNKSLRTKVSALFATYCPFCGEKINRDA